jgi:eukaryotic-like serine/threonine-protein kinase
MGGTLRSSGAMAMGEVSADSATEHAGESLATVVGTPGTVSSEDPLAAREGEALGRYVVIERLGAGSMGVVLRAYDPKLRREVALKQVRSARNHRFEEAQASLLREAQALARLSHPNVVTVFDAEATDRGVCLAMEYVPGSTLRDWSRARARPWPELLDMMLAAAHGLAAAHEKGIVHGDFKPENVLVGSDGRARVTDFGLARGVDHAADPDHRSGRSFDGDTPTEPGAIMGTPAYMSPEQHAGVVADARSDQYTLCVSLWEGLYGKRPFSGPDLEGLAAAKRRGPPARPRGAPAWLHAALARGLSVDPQARWPSVEALLDALSIARVRSRRRKLWIGAGMLALVGGVLVAWEHGKQTQRVAACERAGAEIEEVWNVQASKALRDALMATGMPIAETTHDKLVPWLDRFAEAWSSTRQSLCEQAEIERTWPSELVAGAVACLDERRDALAGLLDVLREPDEVTVHRAVPAAAGLPPVVGCVDRHTAARQPPSAPDAIVGSVAAARRELMRVTGLAAAGRYAEGLTRAQALLEEAESLGYAPLRVRARFAVGSLAASVGRSDVAEAELVRAYAEAWELGMDEIAAEVASRLVHAIGVKGARHDEGLVWADAAQMLLRRLGQHDTLAGAGFWNRLALLHWARGELEEAQSLGERALALYENALGSDHPEVAHTLNALATIHATRGQHDQSRKLQERALTIQERALGSEHPHLAIGLNNLGDLLVGLNELDDAEPLLERAIALDEAALGVDHPEVAHAVHNLARLHMTRGDYPRARELFGRAIALREKGLADHPLLASSLNGLAGTDFAAGDLESAEANFTRALAIDEAVLGPDHLQVSYVLNNLAAVHSRRGSLGEARVLYERALEIRERVLGPEHPELSSQLDNLGRLLVRQGELDAAERFHERAVAVAEKALGREHPTTALAVGSLGALQQARGNHAEAERLHHEALATLERAHGSSHPFLLDPLLALGEIATDGGRPDEAVALLERALSVRGEDPNRLAELQIALARALWDASTAAGGDRSRALALANEAAESLRAAGPEREPEREKVEAWLRASSRRSVAR